jgi:sarcosine oxidase, subunit gamma
VSLTFAAAADLHLGEGCLVLRDGAPAGHVTSYAYSLSLDWPIALAYVHPDDSEAGSIVTLRARNGNRISGTVTAHAFFDPKNSRHMAGASVFPLERSGAAAEMSAHLGRHGTVTVEDLNALPRFGLKGPGSADWFLAQGVPLPEVNRHARHGGITALRLGRNDVSCLPISEPKAPDALSALRHRWNTTAAAKGYSSWREEGWAWLRLGGAGVGDVMCRLCALDLRAGHFGENEIAQTRFVHVDAVLLRNAGGFDILFDITRTAFILASTGEACHSMGRHT